MSSSITALLQAVVLPVLLGLALALSLPFALWRPWMGIVVWHWFGILQPHRYLSGFVATAPLVQPVAMVTLVGLAVTQQRYRMPRVPAVWFAGALWTVFAASTLLTAIDPSRAWSTFLDISKSLLMTGCTVVLIQDTRKLRVLMWVCALSIGALAVFGAVWVIATAAVEPLYGPPGAELGDNNDLAAGLVLALPLLVFLGESEEHVWIRRAMMLVVAATVLSIFGTHSRAGFLGLGVVLLAMACLRRWKVLAVAGAAAALFFATSAEPTKWTSRMQTMTTPAATIREDGSMFTRVRAWSTAFQLGLDHPFLGAGFEPFSPAVYQHYFPGYSDFHNAHNLFLQVFAEHGLVGLSFYCALLASCLWSLERTARRSPRSPEKAWLAPAARAVQIGILAYVTAGMFQCLSYREVFMLWLAFAILLDVLSREDPQPLPPLLGAAMAKLPVWRSAA